MLSDLVKKEIESTTRTMTATNFFFQTARDGRMNTADVKEYLYNIFYLFKQTTLCLAHARNRSLELGMHDLANFFEHKITEEIGHDLWAKDDLASLGSKHDDVDLNLLNPTLKSLVAYIYDMIQKDPKRYLFYMLFAEYFTVLAAPQFLSDLENKCGISRSHLTALVNHGELDKEHVMEDLSIIDQFVGNPENPEAFFEVIANSSRYIGQFLAEIPKDRSAEMENRL